MRAMVASTSGGASMGWTSDCSHKAKFQLLGAERSGQDLVVPCSIASGGKGTRDESFNGVERARGRGSGGVESAFGEVDTEQQGETKSAEVARVSSSVKSKKTGSLALGSDHIRRMQTFFAKPPYLPFDVTEKTVLIATEDLAE